MVDFSERQRRIIETLRPKSIHHGQLDTGLIAVPKSQAEEFPPERLQAIRQSFEVQGSNLAPLIVRRSDAYEQEEYEVIYGADWCLVAKQLDIEKLWVWVFDLDDEQAAAIQAEMELLMNPGTSSSPSTVHPIGPEISVILKQIESLLGRERKATLHEIEQLVSNLIRRVENSLDEKIQVILSKIEQLDGHRPKGRKTRENIPIPVDLSVAGESEVCGALKQVGVSKSNATAAWKAIEYWKTPGREITWENLEQSASAKLSSKKKIRGFAEGTYEKLKEIGNIPQSHP